MLLALEVLWKEPRRSSIPTTASTMRFCAAASGSTSARRAACGCSKIRPRETARAAIRSRIKDGAFPAFTDFGFVALGIPRNPAIPANADPDYFDLGLCGPLRADLARHPEYCGMFRAPSLRNVTLKRRFFHNGAIRGLKNALRFYVERDALFEALVSARPRSSTTCRRCHRANVNREPPFDRATPALSDAELDDLAAFLATLEDGFTPPER